MAAPLHHKAALRPRVRARLRAFSPERHRVDLRTDAHAVGLEAGQNCFLFAPFRDGPNPGPGQFIARPV